jgi:L,D-transpeptidase ErfK/SrfK
MKNRLDIDIPSRRNFPARGLFVCLFMLFPLAWPASAAPSLIIGEQDSYVVRDGDTLLDIAIANDLGYVEIVLANPGVDSWLPRPGQTLTLPTAHLVPEADHKGIVINLTELRLYYFPPDGSPPRTYPIGIGRLGRETPTGRTRLVKKRENPTWIPPASVREERPELPAVVPPGPDNPLGSHALNLAWPSYAIHGTNRPYGVGRRVSHGCIRMYPRDIAELFAQVEVGLPVTVVDQPVKVGLVQGELYLEVHPTAIQADALEATGKLTPYDPPDVRLSVLTAAEGLLDRLDWPLIRQVAQERRGIPVKITRSSIN